MQDTDTAPLDEVELPSNGSTEAVTPADLSHATAEQLLYFSLTGSSGSPSLADGMISIVGELEPLYEAFDAREERWASGMIHLVQCRLRVLAEMARRQEVTRGVSQRS